jgi:hypothetical protein
MPVQTDSFVSLVNMNESIKLTVAKKEERNQRKLVCAPLLMERRGKCS